MDSPASHYMLQEEHLQKLSALRGSEDNCSPSMSRMKPETVDFKRVDWTEWKGPDVVIDQDSAVIFVRHLGT